MKRSNWPPSVAALCFLGNPQVLPGLSKVGECLHRCLLYQRPPKTRWISPAASSIFSCVIMKAVVVSVLFLTEILCFPVRSRCRGEEARVWHALGGERLNGGVSRAPGRCPCPPEGARCSAGWLLYHSSPEGGASRHRELCESQRHLCTVKDTGKQLEARGSTQPGGGKQTAKEELLCCHIFCQICFCLLSVAKKLGSFNTKCYHFR